MRIRTAASGARSQRAKADFDQFVTASSDALLRTAYLVVWDAVEAEDLVQECLLAVARRWPRVRTMDHPHAYARRVLINLALDGAPARRWMPAASGRSGHPGHGQGRGLRVRGVGGAHGPGQMAGSVSMMNSVTGGNGGRRISQGRVCQDGHTRPSRPRAGLTWGRELRRRGDGPLRPLCQ